MMRNDENKMPSPERDGLSCRQLFDKFYSTKTTTAMTKTKELLSGLPKHLPAKPLCVLFDLNLATFKVLLHRAKRLGIEMPARKRLARRYYYDVDAFADWIWQHADKLRGQFGKGSENDDVESAE